MIECNKSHTQTKAEILHKMGVKRSQESGFDDIIMLFRITAAFILVTAVKNRF